MLRTLGYLVSTLGMVLLGVVVWDSAREEPVLLVCLVVGMTAFAMGALLRWLSYRSEQQARRRTSATVIHLVQRRANPS